MRPHLSRWLLLIVVAVAAWALVDEEDADPERRKLPSVKDSGLFGGGGGGGAGGAFRHAALGWRDLDGIFRDYRPFVPDPPLIMFWRPQKVGSSTVLSLLTSYAFRNNQLPRLRSSPNYMCRKMAKCALEHLQAEHRNASNFMRYAQYLEEYTNGLSQGSGTRRQGVPSLKKVGYDLEKISELIGPYTISSNHEVCNLDADLVQEQLRCAFSGIALTRDRPRNAMQNMNRLSVLETRTAMTRNSHEAWGREAKFASALPAVAADRPVHELFVVRNPLSRAISVYYFWGELFKLNHVMKHGASRKRQNKQRQLKEEQQQQQRRRLEIKFRLGQDLLETGSSGIKGSLFTYHGNESTVPPPELALAFANRLPYIAGMPGPSLTWSAFARDKADALRIIATDRIMTIVTERLDESLVVARHYLGWSLADVVVTVFRKALSTHPKYTAWPPEAVAALSKKLSDTGETAVFEAGLAKLDRRIAALTAAGVNVSSEVTLLQRVRRRITTACLSDPFLERYRAFLSKQGLEQHSSENKLRDAEDSYTENGHAFAYNREILYSFDVCGSCEAHAILFSLGAKAADADADVDAAPLLAQLRADASAASQMQGLVQFRKCP